MSQPLAGEIRMFAGNYAPQGWAFCDGQTLPISAHQSLYDILGTTYGGDGRQTFALPDLRGRIPVHRGAGIERGESAGAEITDISTAQMPGHSHTATAVNVAAGSGYAASPVAVVADPHPISVLTGSGAASAAGSSSAHDNMQPYLAIHFIIALGGDMEPVEMTGPFTGEVRIFAGSHTPQGWLRCDGQSLTIGEHTELFSVLGTTYGGDGRDAFALPDLRGRAALHAGWGDGLTLRKLGESGGQEVVALTESQLPHHTHAVTTVAGAAGSVVLASHGVRSTGYTMVQGDSVAPTAEGDAHNNMQPYLVMNFCIATRGTAAG